MIRRGADISQHEKAEALALWSIAVAQFHRPCPGLHRLLFEEFGQQIQVFLLVISLQGIVVGAAVFLVDDHGRIVVDHQPVVQQRPANTPIAVGKGMDILKAGVKICPSFQGSLLPDGVDLVDQLGKIVLDFVRRRAHLVSAGDIVMPFEVTRALTVHDVAALVVGPFCQSTVNGADQVNGERFSRNDLVLQKLVTGLLVLLFKQCTGASGVADDLPVLKNLAGIVIIDLIIFNFTGVVGEQDAEAVQPQVQVCRGSDSPLLSLLHSVVVSAHRNTSVIVLDQLYHKIPRNRKNLLRI